MSIVPCAGRVAGKLSDFRWLHSCNLACGFNWYDAVYGAGQCAFLLAAGMTCAGDFGAGTRFAGSCVVTLTAVRLVCLVPTDCVFECVQLRLRVRLLHSTCATASATTMSGSRWGCPVREFHCCRNHVM